MFKKLDSWLLGDKAIIPFVDVRLTTKCNLNCRECISYMPHLKEKGLSKDVDVDTVLKDIEMLNKNSVYIGTIGFSTGEVLLYPHFKKVLEAVVDNEKIHNVLLGRVHTIESIIITNNTKPEYKISNLSYRVKILLKRLISFLRL